MKKFAFWTFLFGSLALAGTSNLPQISTRVVQLAHVNDIRSALYQDQVPRNASGNTTDLAGSIGSATYRFLKEWVASGGWSIGDIKAHHSYNGAAAIGEGWMLCDGRIITLANYDTEHGSGHFATYVVSTALLNKYLPDLTARYPLGKATTTQDGSVAITATGNSGNTVNLQHSHTVSTNYLPWYQVNATTTPDKVYDNVDVGYQSIVNTTSKNSVSILVGNSSTLSTNLGQTFGALRVGSIEQSFGPNAVASGGSTDNQLSTTQSIKPDSIEVQYYMRVIQ